MYATPTNGERYQYGKKYVYSVGTTKGIIHCLTGSKFIFIEPTFVAPTATIEKNPYRQRPNNATRSFNTKRSGRIFAMYGETEYNSPIKYNSE